MPRSPVPFEAAAMHGEPDPEIISSYDLQIYQNMKYIYQLYSRKEIPAAIAKTLILMLRTVYQDGKRNAKETVERGRYWQKIEPFARAFVFNPTIENADRFFAAVYGLGDNWRCVRAANIEREKHESKEVRIISNAKPNN